MRGRTVPAADVVGTPAQRSCPARAPRQGALEDRVARQRARQIEAFRGSQPSQRTRGGQPDVPGTDRGADLIPAPREPGWVVGPRVLLTGVREAEELIVPHDLAFGEAPPSAERGLVPTARDEVDELGPPPPSSDVR